MEQQGGGVDIISHVLFQNYSVFIEGQGGRDGIFTGVSFDREILFDKAFVLPNTSDIKIQPGF